MSATELLEDCGVGVDELCARVLAKTTTTASGCMEFQGSRSKRGYGSLYVGKRQWLITTRVVAAALLGLDIDDPLSYVCHHCDNPPCCNPDHLFVGTPADNRRDAMAKGRAVMPALTQWEFCLRGHEMAVTRERRSGDSRCGECRREYRAAYERRRRADLKARAAA